MEKIRTYERWRNSTSLFQHAHTCAQEYCGSHNRRRRCEWINIYFCILCGDGGGGVSPFSLRYISVSCKLYSIVDDSTTGRFSLLTSSSTSSLSSWQRTFFEAALEIPVGDHIVAGPYARRVHWMNFTWNTGDEAVQWTVYVTFVCDVWAIRRTMEMETGVIIIMRTEKPQKHTFSCHVAFETSTEILPSLRLPFFVVGKHNHRLAQFHFFSVLRIVCAQCQFFHKNADCRRTIFIIFRNFNDFNDVRNRVEFHPFEWNSDIRFYGMNSFSVQWRGSRISETYFPAFVRLPHHTNIPDSRIIDLIHPFNLRNGRSFCPFKTVTDVHSKTQKLYSHTVITYNIITIIIISVRRRRRQRNFMKHEWRVE